ncbi:hypothetical protein AB0O70_17035, partial [Microbacterium paraoxydans]
ENRVPLPELNHAKEDRAKQKAQKEAELLKVQAGIDNANTMHALGDLDRAEFLRTKETLKNQRAKIEQDLLKLEDEDVKADGSTPYLPAVRNLVEEWDSLPVPVVRGILATLIKRVELFPGPYIEIEPMWTTERWSSLELAV